MSTTDPWDILVTPTERGSLTATPDAATGAIWYALDRDGRRHLLVELPTTEPKANLFATRGVTAIIDQLGPTDGTPGCWIDIACTDPTINDTFTVLAGQLATSLRTAIDRRATVVATLDRWRWFWSNRPGPLTGEEALGLFAELWFLHRWLTFPTAVRWWRGPLHDRHDFVHPDVSVEVKATGTRTDGPATHRITHLDQLDDPETGRLYLFSLIAVEDQLATNSLASLVDHLTSIAAGTPEETTWAERLDAARWHPAHTDRYRTPLRVLAEELYVVDDAFPRLTRRTFPGNRTPSGVTDVTYSVDLAVAVATHRISTSPPTTQLDPLN